MNRVRKGDVVAVSERRRPPPAWPGRGGETGTAIELNEAFQTVLVAFADGAHAWFLQGELVGANDNHGGRDDAPQ